MATKEVATSVSYLYLDVDYSTSIVGTYPNIKLRFTYKMRFHLTARGSVQYTNAPFKFGSNSHTFTINWSAGSGGGYSPYLVSSTLDYNWGTNRSFTASPSFSTSFGNVSASGSISATMTIPAPTVSASVAGIGTDSVTFNVALTSNPNSFYNIRIYYKQYGDSGWSLGLNPATDGSSITGLSSNTTYEFSVQSWAVTGTGSAVTSTTLNATTTSAAPIVIPNIVAAIPIKVDGSWCYGKAYYKQDGAWIPIKGVYYNNGSSWIRDSKW